MNTGVMVEKVKNDVRNPLGRKISEIGKKIVWLVLDLVTGLGDRPMLKMMSETH